MTPAIQRMQKDLDAEVSALRLGESVVVGRVINSATAVYVGNFLACKSTLSRYLASLGFRRNSHVNSLGRFYFKVNNFVEIILAIFYLRVYDLKSFNLLGRNAPEIIEKINNGKLHISAPMSYYLEFRRRMYMRRQWSMGVSPDLKSAEARDTIWIKHLEEERAKYTAKRVILSGESYKIHPAVIYLGIVLVGQVDSLDARLFKVENDAAITKGFVKSHYIRAFLDRLPLTPEETRAIFGFSHADVNIMATMYQDEIERILTLTKNGEYVDV